MRTACCLIGSVVLAVASVVAVPAFAVAATKTLSITPSSNLVDGQSVTIDGHGFSPSTTIYYCEVIVASPPEPSDCGVSYSTTTSDMNGDFSVPYHVHRFITPGTTNTTIDCAQAGANCGIGASDTITAAGAISVPITFAPAPPPTFSIHGTAVTGSPAAPVSGVKVWVYAPSDTWLPSLTTTTGNDGRYAITNPVTGVPYKILFVPPDTSGLAAQWYSFTPSRMSAAMVTLSLATDASRNPVVDAHLVAAASISGTVTNASAAPVVGVTVSLYTTADVNVAPYSTTTAGDGSYAFGAVLPAVYQVQFRAPAASGLVNQWYNGMSTRRAATVVGPSSGEHITNINAQLAFAH
jgi:hypothetical protein